MIVVLSIGDELVEPSTGLLGCGQDLAGHIMDSSKQIAPEYIDKPNWAKGWLHCLSMDRD
ncbi:hypothetical protein Fmac_032672 [Flemingia macrophylla]|uniref:Uncharacterized protein n=1 Tax=Flemingia macrophylla TaxID=520843 RepID=A0ABD1L5M3_9FABA